MNALFIATQIVQKLQQAGYITYFAGGWVRDFLLQVPSDDIDIATEASLEVICSLFPKTIPVGIAFGIIIVVEEGHQFEVATFRKELEHLDGRRPSRIEKTHAEEDAKRRDFTINGLFFDPIKQKLFDFVGGQEDLKRGIIRAIGNPHERFLEDRLRMIRAVRYATKLHFTIDLDTTQAIYAHAKSLFPSVAIERIWQEFQKMSYSARFDQALQKLYELELLSTIFPSLKEISPAQMEQRLSLFSSFPSDCPLIIQLAYLFPDSSLEEHLQLCDQMKIAKTEKEHIRFLHRAKSLLQMPLSWQESLENIEWAYFYAHPLSALFLSIYQTKAQDRLAFSSFHQRNRASLQEPIARLQQKKPYLSSSDLQQAGILPGPRMGQLLKEAERLAINESLFDPKALLNRLKNTPLWGV